MSRTLFLIGILCLVVSIHSAKLRSEALEATGGLYIYIYIYIYSTTKPTVSITDLPLKEGVEGGLSVTYSSVYNNKDCNTNFNLSTKGNEGWCASAKKTGEWVQIDAADEVYWRKVETKARHYQYVKSYTLKYSNDGTTWKDIPGTFAGNTELSQSKVNLIQPPVKARFLRIVVLTFHSWPSMKFDAYYSEYSYIYIYIYIVQPNQQFRLQIYL